MLSFSGLRGAILNSDAQEAPCEACFHTDSWFEVWASLVMLRAASADFACRFLAKARQQTAREVSFRRDTTGRNEHGKGHWRPTESSSRGHANFRLRHGETSAPHQISNVLEHRGRLAACSKPTSWAAFLMCPLGLVAEHMTGARAPIGLARPLFSGPQESACGIQTRL